MRAATLLAAFSLVGFALSGCQCSRGEKEAGSEAGASPLEAKPSFDVHPASGVAPRGVIVALSADQRFCGLVREASVGRAHVLCGKGASGPLAMALRGALTDLKKEQGSRVLGGSISLLSTDDHAGAIRRLVSEEPSFFARSGVWVGSSAGSHLGTTFVTRAGSHGADALVLVVSSGKRMAHLVTIGKRNGLRVVLLATEHERPVAEDVEQVLRELKDPALVGDPPNSPTTDQKVSPQEANPPDSQDPAEQAASGPAEGPGQDGPAPHK